MRSSVPWSSVVLARGIGSPLDHLVQDAAAPLGCQVVPLTRAIARHEARSTHQPTEDLSVIARSLLAALLLAFLAPDARAQDAERTAVLATVQRVFDAMRTRDTALLRQAFDTSA